MSLLSPAFQRVVILKADRQTAVAIELAVRAAWRDAAVVTHTRVAQAAAALAAEPCDLLITGIGMMDGDTCSLIRECARAPGRARRIFISTGRPNAWVFRLLRELPIDGAFDSNHDDPARFPDVLRTLAVGGRYFSESFLCFPWANDSPQPAIFGVLTDAEILILAVIGDGCDRKTAAARLELSVETINSACSELHRKLGVHHDRDLIAIACSAGLINYEFGTAMRSGVELLVERYERAQKVKRPRPAFLADLCARAAACCLVRPALSGSVIGSA